MKQKAQPIHEATRMDKRVETMPDGRYMLFYTFPDITKDRERLAGMMSKSQASPGSQHPESKS